MKYVFFIVFLLIGGLYAGGQTPCTDCDCLIRQAQGLMDQGDYKNALLKWQSARICAPDKSVWIDAQIQLLFEKALQRRKYAQQQATKAESNLIKARGNILKYYEAEAWNEFRQDNGRLAWLLAQEALSIDPENIGARRLVDTLPPFLANIYLENGPLTGFRESVFWSPEGRWVAVLSDVLEKQVAEGGRSWNKAFYTLHLYNLATRKEVFQQEEVDPAGISFSPDGRFLLFRQMGNDQYSEVRVLDVERKNVIFKKGNIEKFRFSPDGNMWAFWQKQDQTIHLYDASLGKEVFQRFSALDEHFQFSPDSRYFFFVDEANGANGVLNLWDVSNQSLIFSTPEPAVLNPFWIHPDWKSLAYILPSSNSSHTFHLWDLELAKEKVRIEGIASSGALLRDFDLLLTHWQTEDETGALVAFDLKSGAPILDLPGSILRAHKLIGDHRYLACFLEGGEYASTFQLWDLQDGKNVLVLDSINTYSISYYPERKIMEVWRSLDKNGLRRVFFVYLEEEGNVQIDTLDTHSWKFSPDRSVFAFFQEVYTRRGNGVLVLKDMDSGEILLRESGVNSHGGGYFFSETQPCFIYAKPARTMHWWDYREKKELKKVERVGRLIGRKTAPFFYSHASRHGDDQLVDLHVWNLNKYGEGFTIKQAVLKRGDLFPDYYALNDLKFFGATNLEQDLLIYKMDTGAREVYPNVVAVEEMQFSPNSKWIAVLGKNGLVKMFSLRGNPDWVEPEFEFTHAEKEYYGIE